MNSTDLIAKTPEIAEDAQTASENSSEKENMNLNENTNSQNGTNNTAFQRFMNHRAHSFAALAARYYLAYVFISACIHKLQAPESFAVDIATYQFLPLVFINPMAIMLPWVELGTGVMLATGFKARAGALMAAGMMVMFMIALSFALANDLSISCGCFASNAAAASDPISFLTMIRDSAWLLLAVYVVIFDQRPIGLDRIISASAAKKRKTS